MLKISRANPVAVAVCGVVSLVAVGILGASHVPSGWGRAAALRAEYPVIPFPHVPSDYPRILPQQEPPRKDGAEHAEYDAWRQRFAKYLLEEGAIRHATAAEQEAFRTVFMGKYVRGRELAAAVLKGNPDSIPALYALAKVYADAEGILPQALFQIRKARHLIEKQGRADPGNAAVREWYILTLALEHEVLAALDRSDEALCVIDRLEGVYDQLPQRKIWPLIKLRRLDEAEAAVRAAEADGRWPATVLNSRCVLEDERGHRGAAFTAGQRMVAAYAESPVLWKNFGGAAQREFRLEEAERAFVQSTKAGPLDYSGTAFLDLAMLYIQEGRMREAIDALKQARGARAGRRLATLQDDQGLADRALALLLIALGRGQEADRFARRAYECPNRTGHSTGTSGTEALASGILLWTVLQTRIEQMREANGIYSGLELAARQKELRRLEFEAWTIKRRMRTLLSDSSRPNELIPYVARGAGTDSWLLGTVVRLLPPGIALESVRLARVAEHHPGAVPYLDAIDAEAALGAGDPQRALKLADQALQQLPQEGEKLLRARTSAVGGDAARRLGKAAVSLQMFDRALTDFPQVFRLLGIALPVKIQDDGSPLAKRVAEALRRSPRFVESSGGFPITVNSAEGVLAIAMFRLGGTRHFDTTVPARGEAEDVVVAAVTKMHDRLASPTIDMSQIEINSLDGSPVAEQARNQVDGVLNWLRPQ